VSSNPVRPGRPRRGTAVGVDGCSSGWVAIALGPDGDVSAHHLPAIEQLGAAIPDAEAVGIDIPIGLPEAAAPRAADLAARAMLGPRRSSVFTTPVRAALAAVDHAAATAVSVHLTGAGISRQVYALAAKILEVEAWLPSAPWGVWEVHPEVSFARMLGAPARASKKTWAGMTERRAALAAAGIRLDHLPPDATGRAAVDDVLDAAAVAWTARRLLEGTAESLPNPPEIDASGRAVAIWV
jgi:predicted RNase H-like nuclease